MDSQKAEVAKDRDHYLYYNGHGDLAATADASGTSTASETYDPFGAPLAGQPANSTVHLFTGRWNKQYDTSSNLVLMGARPYDPSLGRFLEVDPIDGGSLNNYDYANQDPVNRYDLNGKMLTGLTGTEVHEDEAALQVIALFTGGEVPGASVTEEGDARCHNAGEKSQNCRGYKHCMGDRVACATRILSAQGPYAGPNFSIHDCLMEIVDDPGESESFLSLIKDFWKSAIYDCVKGGFGVPGP